MQAPDTIFWLSHMWLRVPLFGLLVSVGVAIYVQYVPGCVPVDASAQTGSTGLLHQPPIDQMVQEKADLQIMTNPKNKAQRKNLG